jgi:hypothetical protein
VIDGRMRIFRAALAIFWIASNALVVVLAADQPGTVHPVRGGVALVAMNAAAPLVAVTMIRSRAILLVTLVISGWLALAWSWSIMRDEASTAPVGIPFTALAVFFLAVVGAVVDYIWRNRAKATAPGR